MVELEVLVTVTVTTAQDSPAGSEVGKAYPVEEGLTGTDKVLVISCFLVQD